MRQGTSPGGVIRDEPDMRFEETTTTVKAVHAHPRGRRRPLTVAGAAVAVLVAGGCAEDAPQDTWQPAGENAQTIHDLQWPVFLIAGIVGLLVFSAVTYAVSE